MVESSPSRRKRPPCKTSKEMSDEAADAAALTYLTTYSDNCMKDLSLNPFWTPLSVRMWRMLSRFRHPPYTRKRESIPPCFCR